MEPKNNTQPSQFYSLKPISDISNEALETEPTSKDEAAESMERVRETIERARYIAMGYKGCFIRYQPRRILKSGNATIVFWGDGTKTVVKRSEGEPDDPYAAFGAALCKKLYGSNSAVKKLIERKTEVQTVKEKGD